MGHVTRDTSRAIIDIDTVTGQILIQQRWLYRWSQHSSLPVWTLAEKRAFHRRADLAVWDVWSNRARLSVTGTSNFSRRFAAAGVPINLDIDWVLGNQHWIVSVRKLGPSETMRSQVFWNDFRIQLTSRDYRTVSRTVGGQRRRQRTVAHEFGHSAGNTGHLGRGDEYPEEGRTPSPHIPDSRSIMNVGEELRVRHFRTIIEELDQMIPNTRFSVRSL